MTLCFSAVVHDTIQSGINLNDDLEKISSGNKLSGGKWVSILKLINKREKLFFLAKFRSQIIHLWTVHALFNGTCVTQSEIQKHLRMFLDSKLDFKEHIKNVLNKVSKTMGLLRTLPKILRRPPLITIYKSFIRPHPGYGDIIYDQAYNVSFHEKLESI